jgi:hypothetical protein
MKFTNMTRKKKKTTRFSKQERKSMKDQPKVKPYLTRA